MAREPSLFVRDISPEEGQKLTRITRRSNAPIRLRRAAVVLASAQGRPMRDICMLLQCSESYVRDVVHARLRSDELAAILHHEREHARRRDPLRLALCRVAAVALWPFPIVHDLRRHAELEAEIRADEAAKEAVGVSPLSRALDAILEALPNVGDGDQLLGWTRGADQLPRHVASPRDSTEPRSARGDRRLFGGRLGAVGERRVRSNPRGGVAVIVGWSTATGMIVGAVMFVLAGCAPS